MPDLQILQIARGEKIQRSKRRSGRIRNVKVWIFGILVFFDFSSAHDTLTHLDSLDPLDTHRGETRLPKGGYYRHDNFSHDRRKNCQEVL